METQEKKKKNIIPYILMVVIIGGAIFGIKEYLYFSKHIDTDDAQVDGDISPIVSRVGGYVDTIMFEENEHVNQGQLLIKLDDRDYQIKLGQTVAAQNGAIAGIGVTQSQISAAAANSITAKSNIEAAKIKLWQQNKDFERYSNLVKDGAVTQQQFDQVKAQKETEEANYQAMKDQYKATLEQVGTSRSQLRVSNNGADQKQADIDFAKLQLSYTTISSPASGIVSKKSVQKGQLVQAGQTLFSVVNDNSLFVTANFKETQLEKLHPGQKVDIQVDAFPDMKVSGELYNFAPATGAKFSLLPPDNASGNYVKVVQRIPVKIKIKDGQEVMKKLRPGMSVKVSVLIEG